MHASAFHLLAMLRRLRRRALAMLVISYAAAGVVYAIVGCLISRIICPALLDLPVGWVLTGGLAAILGGAVGMAMLRCPSMRGMAALVDRACHLQQRLVTALECLHQQDEVALLLQHDAQRHLRAVLPARVLPWQMSLNLRRLVIFALIWVSVTLSAPYILSLGNPWQVLALLPGMQSLMLRAEGVRKPGPLTEEEPSHLRPPSAVPAPLSPVSATQGVRPPAPTSSGALEVPPQAFAPQDIFAAPQTVAGEPRSSPDDQAPFPVASATAVTVMPSPARASLPPRAPHEPTAPAHRVEKALQHQGLTTPSIPADSSNDAALDAMLRREDTPGDRRRMPSSATMPSAAPSGSSSMPPVSTMPPEGAQVAAVISEGDGLAGEDTSASHAGTLVAPGQVPASDSASHTSYRAAYHRAWDTAEAVLAQERIPAGLRHYIREYFLAIHP